MAKVMDGASSRLSGKADGRVYVQFNGGTYTRRLPRRTKDSTTLGMLLNQRRFREVNQFCAQFKTSVIPQIWNGMDKRMSGYALFLKSNMSAFGADGSIVDAKKIEVFWPREMNVGGIHMRDELMVISALEGQYSDIMATGITKADLMGTFELPELFSEASHIYLFFSSRDHREYSESMCVEI